LKKEILEKGLQDSLAIADPKLAGNIREKLGIQCIHDNSIMELMRGIRTQLENLVTDVSSSDFVAMSLGLSHSLSRYKLKFSPDKVDTMIVQAIALLDDLDKELNTYAMRVREWYGWHFPELSKLVPENILYAKIVKQLGIRVNVATTDLTGIIPEQLQTEIHDTAQISMGTEISNEDIATIQDLCEQVISISEYREQLYEYLKNRMQAIAPNLTILVGELVGARLIAHAGSLLNLAKYPASTIQILGAEKALFRALKTKRETPKYGLIYHASLVGQTAPKNKGKISRLVAAKTALATRFDALAEGEQHAQDVGEQGRIKIEERLKSLEGGHLHSISGSGRGKPKKEAFNLKKTDNNLKKFVPEYNTAADSTVGNKKRKQEEDQGTKKKKKKQQKEEEEEGETDEVFAEQEE